MFREKVNTAFSTFNMRTVSGWDIINGTGQVKIFQVGPLVQIENL